MNLPDEPRPVQALEARHMRDIMEHRFHQCTGKRGSRVKDGDGLSFGVADGAETGVAMHARIECRGAIILQVDPMQDAVHRQDDHGKIQTRRWSGDIGRKETTASLLPLGDDSINGHTGLSLSHGERPGPRHGQPR